MITVQDDIPVAEDAVEEGYVEEESLPGGNDDSDDVAGIDGDGDGNNGVWSSSVSGLFSIGADQSGSYRIVSGIDGGAVVTTGGAAVSSEGVAVTYEVVDATTVRGVAGGETVFEVVLDGTTGDYTFTLLGQLDHHAVPDADDVEGVLSLDLSGTIEASDEDGDRVGLGDGSLVITVQDDIPVDIEPDDAFMPNVPGATDTEPLDFFDSVGADRSGSVMFFQSYDGALLLNSEGDPVQSEGKNVVLELSPDGTVLTGYLEGEPQTPGNMVIQITLNPDGETETNDNYSVELFKMISDDSMMDFSDFSNVTAGNKQWAGIDGDNVGISDPDPDPNSSDLLITAVDPTDSVNNDSDDIAVSNQWIGDNAGEGIRIDFVRGINTNPPQDESDDWDNPTPPFTDNGHYDANSFEFTVIQVRSNGTATLILSAVHADDDGILAGDPDDTSVFIDASDVIVDSTGTITITQSGNDVIISGLEGGDKISFSTDDAFNRVVIANDDSASPTDDDPFAIGGFGVGAAAPAEPVSMDFDVVVKDGDGDESDGQFTVTLTPDPAPVDVTVGEPNLPDGTNPDGTALTQSETLGIEPDADADIVDTRFINIDSLPELTSGGVQVEYSLSPDGHTLTAKAGGETVFTVVVTDPTDPDGGQGYEFTLHGPLDHVDSDEHELDFDFEFDDSDDHTKEGTFTVTVLDDHVPGSDSLTVAEDGVQTINTSADATSDNTSVPDKGEPDGPSHGTAVINPDGTLTYTPDEHYSGTDELTYTHTDEDGNDYTTTVTITVTPVSDAPELSRDALNVRTDEDVSVALGFNAPVVSDGTDQNGGQAGDNPELLGAIQLRNIPAGAKLLYADGTTVLESDGSTVNIVLSDGSHITGVTGDVTMTTAEFEGLRVLPPADTHNNFSVRMRVTEYEVDDSGNPLPGVDGAVSNIKVNVRVLAVTDKVEISWNEGGDFPDTDETPDDPDTINKVINEDAVLDLTSMLNYSFTGEPDETTTQTPPIADGNNTTPDFDGSESRELVIGESGGTVLPPGTIVKVDGVAIDPESDGTYSIALTNDQTIPPITIQPPEHFSGDILEDIPVTVVALDSDSDSSGANPVEESDTVYFNLYVNPVAGDVEAQDVSTEEDTAVKFMEELGLTDTDGSESIVGIVIKDIPDGWELYDSDGTLLITGNGSDDWTVDTADVTSGDYTDYTLLPPGHSSVDETVNIDVTTTDTQTVNGSTVSDTQTVTLPVKIEVTPVAEKMGPDADKDGQTDTPLPGQADSDDNGTADLQMNPSHEYTVNGTEDEWFSLHRAGISGDPDGFDLETPWFNEDTETSSYQDNSEETFALFTPKDSEGNDLLGSQFRYDDGTPEGRILTYTGSPVEVPVQYLDSLEFMPPANFAEEGIEIVVNAKTVDTDPDDGSKSEQISGEVVLTIDYLPVADQVSLAVSSPGGDEDTQIPINIRPQSDDKDGSESFTVTIDNVPSGAVLHYNGSVLTGTAGTTVGTLKYTIPDFDEDAPLTIQPPLNSDVDLIELDVQAVSEDGVDASPSTALPLKIDVRGVADTVDLTTTTPKFAEADVDTTGEVTLNQVVTGYTMQDDDGSETLTFRITGLDPQFSIDCGTFLGGTGTERVWVLTEEDLAAAKIRVPANFSGTVNLTMVAITTEREGDSHTEDPIDLSVEITPSPEAEINSSATIPEDATVQVDFSIQHRNGDTDETLTSVWIKAADVDGADYMLYLGSDGVTTLADAAADPAVTDVVLDGGYYKLTGSAIDNIYVQNEADLHGDYTFDIKYEITDNSSDGTLDPPDSPATTQSDAVYNLSFAAVTDPISQTLGTITLDDPGDGTVEGNLVSVTENTIITIPVTVTQVDDPAEGPNDKDDDGSEKLEQFIIDNVPQGVTVVGGTYIGNVYDSGVGDNVNSGRWIIDIDPNQAFTTSDSGTITTNIAFAVDGTAEQLGGLSQTITITAVSRDEGSGTQQAMQSFTLTVADADEFDDSESPVFINEPSTIDLWSENTDSDVIEDTPISLGEMVNAQISAGTNSTFDITLTDFPPGTVITGMTATVLPGGETVYTVSGSGGNVVLQTVLDSITITPPANWNDNNHGNDFDFKLTLTTRAPGGERNDQVIEVNNREVVPVTDHTTIVINTPDVDEDNDAGFTVSFSNGADGGFTTVQGPLYLKVDDSGMHPPEGGTLYHNGSPVSVQSITGVPGVPDGDYYVIDPVEFTDTVQFTYEPEGNAAGSVGVTAYLRTQEESASNILTNTATASFDINPVNDGYDAEIASASGDEDTMIEIELDGTGLRDTDGSEEIVSAFIENVPDGFLVFTGSSQATAVLAINVGDDGTGNNTWSIPLDPDGSLPDYIAVRPPENYSGTVQDCVLMVYSGEQDLEPTVDMVTFDLEVEPVADPVDPNLFIPTTSFGVEGEAIPINLNKAMEDQDGSETLTLTFQGIGAGAAFFDSAGNLIDAAYDAGTDTYTLTGVPGYDPAEIYDVNHLTLVQSALTGTVTVTAYTVDGSDDSSDEAVTKTFTLDISQIEPTGGDDTLFYDGDSGRTYDGFGGEDMITLQLNQDLDFNADTSTLANIEIIDLDQNGDHQLLHLSETDVLQSTDENNVLTVLGDAGDSVQLAGSWASSVDGGFTVYTSGDAVLRVENDITMI